MVNHESGGSNHTCILSGYRQTQSWGRQCITQYQFDSRNSITKAINNTNIWKKIICSYLSLLSDLVAY